MFSCSVMSNSETPWTAALQACLFFTIFWSLLKLRSIESVMPSSHLVLCHLLLLLSSVFPSIKVFSNELALHIRWPKYWSFSISPTNKYSGLISLESKELSSLLQYHNSKASILRCSPFFMVQLSHPYTTTGKTIALTKWLPLCQQSDVSAFYYTV